jgi:hypothetical protein
LILVPCLIGDVLDKLTILELKILHIHDIEKVKMLQNEKTLLATTLDLHVAAQKLDRTKIEEIKSDLYNINMHAWKEIDKHVNAIQENDAKVLALAAYEMHHLNKRRISAKNKANALDGSLLEIKNY